jgi:hypothetical protein
MEKLKEVWQVLEAIGWPAGHQGRTNCPLHRGKNLASFSYRGDEWCCFACGEAGHTSGLAIRLGLEMDGTKKVEFKLGGTEEMKNIGSGVIRQPPPLRVAERMRRAALDERELEYDDLSDVHRLGCELMTTGEWIYRHLPADAAEMYFRGMALRGAAAKALNQLTVLRNILSATT